MPKNHVIGKFPGRETPGGNLPKTPFQALRFQKVQSHLFRSTFGQATRSAFMRTNPLTGLEAFDSGWPRAAT